MGKAFQQKRLELTVEALASIPLEDERQIVVVVLSANTIPNLPAAA
jgi:hypothetical protein